MMIVLTTSDGRDYEVDTDFIGLLTEAIPGEWLVGSKTIVVTKDGRQQAVQQTIAQIKELEDQAHEAKKAVSHIHKPAHKPEG